MTVTQSSENVEIARLIDHTLLSSNCSESDIKNLCEEALKHNFKAVCVPPYHVRTASNLLKDSQTAVATVVGFPMGYSCTPAKVEEIKRAIDEGAQEIDVVLNISAIKSGDWNYVKNDINSMTMAAHLKGKVIKIILEVSLLNDEEIAKICEICLETKPNFVKTSTGFNGGATVDSVRKLKLYVKDIIKIKASGGIKTKADAISLINAGASRIGSSSGPSLI